MKGTTQSEEKHVIDCLYLLFLTLDQILNNPQIELVGTEGHFRLLSAYGTLDNLRTSQCIAA